MGERLTNFLERKKIMEFPFFSFRLRICLACIFFGLLLFSTHPGIAQQGLPLDSSQLEQRSGLRTQVGSYLKQKEFNYSEQTPETVGFWDRFIAWIWREIDRLFSKEGFRKGFDVFLWLASISILLYAVLRYLGMEKVKFWITGQGGGAGIVGERVEDIHVINYPASIEEAEREGRFRDAIRFHFLRILKGLSDKEIIHWHRNKTNIEYAREISSRPESAGFERVRRIYEYAWYGEFKVTERDYQTLLPYFHDFEKSLGL
jgi:hypothetical protein